MNKKNLFEKIISKKEFSDLPKEDVRLVFQKFDKPEYLDEEKLKLTRDLLRKMYTVFLSGKLLNFKSKEPFWFLSKHLSTRERLSFYPELYKKIFQFTEGEWILFDLGSGVNGFSSFFFPKKNLKLKYLGIEAVGQLIEIQNKFFHGNKNFEFFHESLFDLEKIKTLFKKEKGKKIVFLFKVLDSLEMLKKDYSKTFLTEISPLADLFVVSFATRSILSKKKFFVERRWIYDFLDKNFLVLNKFELGNEEYTIFSKKDL